jgi:glycosyltransferase involved in cell wall biosynthesis
MTKLSVVLISRNQDWNIARLISSVLREGSLLNSMQVILVDSASSDRTTEIAARYPITVLKLHPDQHLSASAGRYVGYKQAKGDLVLFLDGDMELCHGWLAPALEVMQSRPEVAVVCGRVVDRPIETTPQYVQQHDSLSVEVGKIVNVLHGGGASLYRRAVLEQVGTFNPYLYSDEEPELCLRIRHAGFQILRLPRTITFHYTVPWEALATFLAKRKGKIWLGYGQNFRYLFGTRLFLPYLKERGWAVAPAFVLGAGLIAAAVSILTGQWVWLLLWAALMILLTLGIAIRKRSLERALLIIFRKLLILDGTIRGFILKPYDPSSYPGKCDLIK